MELERLYSELRDVQDDPGEEICWLISLSTVCCVHLREVWERDLFLRRFRAPIFFLGQI